MRQLCNYIPERDLAKHRPSLHVDLDQVFDTMTLPAGGAFSAEFDNIDDTDDIGPLVTDVFDAVEYGITLNENIKAMEYASGTGNTTTTIVSTSDGGAE